MEEFTIIERPGEVLVANDKKDVVLKIEEHVCGIENPVYFMSDRTKYDMLRKTKWGYKEWIQQSTMITGRDTASYPKQVRDILNSDLQYLEIGTGLGEPICDIVRYRNSPKPISIDPADYNLLEEMLVFARYGILEKVKMEKSRNIIKPNLPRIDVFLERCRIIQDSNNVVLFNTNLKEAFQSGKLNGVADIVVDFYGAKHNSDKDCPNEQRNIDDLELKLLKPTGKLIQYKWGDFVIYDNCDDSSVILQ